MFVVYTKFKQQQQQSYKYYCYHYNSNYTIMVPAIKTHQKKAKNIYRPIVL